MASLKPSCLIIGTGEYVSGYVHGSASPSDKKVGVVGLVLFDLRRRGLIGPRIVIAGTNGSKFPGIRQHFQKNIAEKYKGMDVSFEAYPAEGATDPRAFVAALDSMKPGDLVFIFTPDDTHYEMVKESIVRGLHVLVTKPAVQTLAHHQDLVRLAEKHRVLVSVEVHKRWDPIYADARERIRNLGDFGYYSSYMSQPKKQLLTFKAWAGKSSDISYYLNSHHLDFHVWAMEGRALPRRIIAMGATGVAKSEPYECPTEDTITLLVQWENLPSKNTGTAVYTASWSAPGSDVHSQQRFHYLGAKGEIQADQAHRGYTVATDADGFASVNPLYMKYTPDTEGYFAGQNGYGYRSLELFAAAACRLRNEDSLSPTYFDSSLATMRSGELVTAILEGGRRSLDANGAPVYLVYDSDHPFVLKDLSMTPT